jgi:hypothetical protein
VQDLLPLALYLVTHAPDNASQVAKTPHSLSHAYFYIYGARGTVGILGICLHRYLATMPSHLLLLSTELRIMIYRLLLVSPKSIEIDYDRYPGHAYCRYIAKNRLPAGSAAILRVCKQIHVEAEDILYTSNHFTFLWRTYDQVPLFLTSISSHAYSKLSKLHISLGGGPYQYLDLLTGCTGLENLTISSSQRIPKTQIAVLSGLRIRHFRVVKRWCGAEYEIHSLTSIITGSRRRSRDQETRSAETRSEKVSKSSFCLGVAYLTLHLACPYASGMVPKAMGGLISMAGIQRIQEDRGGFKSDEGIFWHIFHPCAYQIRSSQSFLLPRHGTHICR